MGRVPPSDKDREIAALIEQALMEIDAIEAGADQKYAEGSEQEYWKRRPMTMKDAKPKARNAAILLRQAWDLADPAI